MAADIKEQAEKLSRQAAGYVGTRTVEIGLRHGIIEALADRADGATPGEIADAAELDRDYTKVWFTNALANELVERTDGDRFRLAPHMDALLLDGDHPMHQGATFQVLMQPDNMDRFSEHLPTGERFWWNDLRPEYIRAVSRTGRTFYSRLMRTLDQVAGLTEHIRTKGADARILDTACGAGVGLTKLAAGFPEASFVGADGDAYSLQVAQATVEDAGIADRVALVETPLEEMPFEEEFDLVVNNISMHECRDIDEVTRRVRTALRPEGYFVVSDIPFPEEDEDLRTPPGRIMSGIQYFESLIGDQLQPPSAYVDLLGRHGFREVDQIEISPVHALTFGQR